MSKTKTKWTPEPYIVNVWTTGRRTVETREGLVIAEIHRTHIPTEQPANATLFAQAPAMAAELVEFRLFLSMFQQGIEPQEEWVAERIRKVTEILAASEGGK